MKTSIQKYLRVIIALFAFALISSCEYKIDLDRMDLESKLFILCKPGDCDSCIVHIQKSIKANGNYNESSIPRDLDFYVYVNGNPIQTRRLSDGEVDARFSFVADFQPGDAISMTASATGLKSVSSEDVIPSKPITPEIKWTENTEDRHILGITIKDDPATEDWYSVMLIDKFVTDIRNTDYGEERYSYKEEYDTLNIDNMIGIPSLPTPNNMVIPCGFYNEAFAMSDKAFVDDTKTFSLGFSQNEDLIIESVQPSLEQHEKYLHFYKVVVCHISNSFWNYYRSRYSYHNDELGELGWAPSFYAFSNVKDGLGLMGTCQRSESSWLPNYGTREIKL